MIWYKYIDACIVLPATNSYTGCHQRSCCHVWLYYTICIEWRVAMGTVGAMGMLWASGHLMVMWSLHGVLGQRKDWGVSSLCVCEGVCVHIPCISFHTGDMLIAEVCHKGNRRKQCWATDHEITYDTDDTNVMLPTILLHTAAATDHKCHCSRCWGSTDSTHSTAHSPLLLLAVEWLQPMGSYFLPKGAFDCRTVSFVISIPIEFKIYSDRVTRIWRWEYATLVHCMLPIFLSKTG